MPTGIVKRSAVLVGLLIAAAGLFAVLFIAAVHAYPGDSDSASVVLEGQAMAHGNLLLHGWELSLDSFWSVDAPFYLVATALSGIRGSLIFAVPAAIAVAIICIGVFMACEKRQGAAAVAAGATVVAILGLPGHVLSIFFVHGGWHVTTAMLALIAFLGLRKRVFGWAWVVAVLVLTAGLLGDLMIVPLAIAPIVGAGLVAMMRTRDLRTGLPALAAAGAAVLLAVIGRAVVVALGGFAVGGPNRRPPIAQIFSNVAHGLHQGAVLLGVGSSYLGLGGEPDPLSWVHVLAVAVIFVAVAGACVALLTGALRGRPTVVGAGSRDDAWHLDDMLLIASTASFVTFVLLAIAPDMKYSRYLTGGVIFGTILAGRMVGRFVKALPATGWAIRACIAVGMIAVTCFAAGLVVNISQPVPLQPASRLSSFLEAHGLTRGIGDYWSASIVTVVSHAQVKVRPVISAYLEPASTSNARSVGHAPQKFRSGVRKAALGSAAGNTPNIHLVRYARESANSWYAKPFRFLVYNYRGPWGNVTSATADATFGIPKHVYVVGPYQVMVWPHRLIVPAHGAASGGSHRVSGLRRRR
ncbi:MAG: hypothetical protein ACYDEY_12555 [Acidimicrobiales bacterium]